MVDFFFLKKTGNTRNAEGNNSVSGFFYDMVISLPAFINKLNRTHGILQLRQPN